MSNDALTWAWGAPLESGPKFVLVALADHGSDHSGEDWACFPSVKRLCDRTGFSVKTVERHLGALEKQGWLSRTRRRRADGTLGIYDYRLHRDGQVREALKAQRNQADAGADDAESPAVKLTGGEGAGPSDNLAQTTGQFGGQPPVKLTGQEPSREPSEEPSHRVRAREAGEPGSDGFEAGWAAYPQSGQERTDDAAARAAWALAAGEAGREALILAVIRYAEGSPSLKTGDYGAPGFQRWLSERRWRAWLAPVEPVAATNAVRWSGPDDVRAALVGAKDEAWVRSWIDPCGFRPKASDDNGGAILARTAFAAKSIEDAARAVLKEHGLTVEVVKV